MNSGSAYYDYVKERLRGSDLFRGLSDGLLQDMLSGFQQSTWRKGVSFHSRDLADRFHIIIDGRVELRAIDAASGKALTLFILGPGDGFDVISLLDGCLDDNVVRALEDLHLIHAPARSVRGWISDHPAFNRNFLPYAGKQMRTMQNIAVDLATADTATRLARLILRHVTPAALTDGAYPTRLINDLPHEALARLIGSTRQVVNQHLQVLRHKGVIRGATHDIHVAKLERLRKQARGLAQRGVWH